MVHDDFFGDSVYPNQIKKKHKEGSDGSKLLTFFDIEATVLARTLKTTQKKDSSCIVETLISNNHTFL